MKNKVQIAIFISGKGTNALNLIRYFKNHSKISVDLIFSTRPNETIEKISSEVGISFIHYSPDMGDWHEVALKACNDFQIDFIVLAGFLKKVTPSIIAAYPNRIINIHPSLLPKFGGKGMYGKHVHEAVIASGEKKSGITVHFVNDAFDEGEIIAQYDTIVYVNETPESLAEKIHKLEMEFFPKVLEKVIE